MYLVDIVPVCSDYSPVGRKSREVDSGAAVEAEDGVGGRPRRTRGLHPVADMSTLKLFFSYDFSFFAESFDVWWKDLCQCISKISIEV